MQFLQGILTTKKPGLRPQDNPPMVRLREHYGDLVVALVIGKSLHDNIENYTLHSTPHMLEMTETLLAGGTNARSLLGDLTAPDNAAMYMQKYFQFHKIPVLPPQSQQV